VVVVAEGATFEDVILIAVPPVTVMFPVVALAADAELLSLTVTVPAGCCDAVELPTVIAPPVLPVTVAVTFAPPVTVVAFAPELLTVNVVLVVGALLSVVAPFAPLSETVKDVKPAYP